jgi:hypothetical protein
VAAGWLRMGIGYGVAEVELVPVLVIAVRVSVAVEKSGIMAQTPPGSENDPGTAKSDTFQGCPS